MPIEQIRYVVTGPNARSGSLQVSVDGTGSAQASIVIPGAQVGTDTVQAFMDSKTLSSNLAQVAWQGTNGDIAVTPVSCYGWAGTGSGVFTRTDMSNPVLAKTVNSLMFNTHPADLLLGDPYSSGDESRPFLNHVLSSSGAYVTDSSMSPLGTGAYFSFDLVMTGAFVVATPGVYAFKGFADDGYFVGIGNGATRVSGPTIGMNFAATPMRGLPVLWASNQVQSYNTSGRDGAAAYINFPAAGVYPFEICFCQASGEAQFSLMLGDSGAYWAGYRVIKPVNAVSVPTTTSPGSGNLLLTPTASGPNIIGSSQTFNLRIQNVQYTTKPYIGILEGHAGKLYIYNDPVANTFSLPSFNGTAVDKTAAKAAFTLGGDNASWQGRLAVDFDGTNFILNYNGQPVDAHVATTQLTITDEDIAWYNGVNKALDIFIATSQGGGKSYGIEIDYLVSASVASVTPTQVTGDGVAHNFTINLAKPLPPMQNGTVCTPTVGGAAFTVNSVTPSTDPQGWTTGWTVNATVPLTGSAVTAVFHVKLSGSVTYLKVDSFVTETVTYYDATAANITVTGATNVAPQNYAFSVTSDGLDAASSGIGTNTTFRATVLSTQNNFGSAQFYRQAVGTSTRTAVGTPVGPTNIRQSSGNWLADYTVTATSSSWYNSTQWSLGYTETDTDGLGVTYWDSRNFSSNNTAPGTGTGGCVAESMFLYREARLADVFKQQLVDCLNEEDYSIEQRPIQNFEFKSSECFRIKTERGAELIMAWDTPLVTQEWLKQPREECFAKFLVEGFHVLVDLGAGVEWDTITEFEFLGTQSVVRIYVGGFNFAAGVEPTKRIFTHNALNNNVNIK